MSDEVEKENTVCAVWPILRRWPTQGEAPDGSVWVYAEAFHGSHLEICVRVVSGKAWIPALGEFNVVRDERMPDGCSIQRVDGVPPDMCAVSRAILEEILMIARREKISSSGVPFEKLQPYLEAK